MSYCTSWVEEEKAVGMRWETWVGEWVGGWVGGRVG